MSSEYKDWINDLRAEFNEKMWEITELYHGWYVAFIPQMMDELFDAIGGYIEEFEVYQIKEKFGEMRIYYGWADRDYTEQELKDLKEIDEVVDGIINKYTDISKNTCVKCGAKATRFSDGWVLPYCESCDFLKPAIMRC